MPNVLGTSVLQALHLNRFPLLLLTDLNLKSSTNQPYKEDQQEILWAVPLESMRGACNRELNRNVVLKKENEPTQHCCIQNYFIFLFPCASLSRGKTRLRLIELVNVRCVKLHDADEGGMSHYSLSACSCKI